MATKKQDEARRKAFTENRAKGMSRRDSAIAAGYSDAEKSGDHVERGELVKRELAALRLETAKNMGITKEQVAAGFLDAANMAQVMADPQGMVAAWRELGKMLGFYAPEVKKIEKGINKADLLKALDSLDDEELLRLSRGRVIDGEFHEVNEDVPRLPAQ